MLEGAALGLAFTAGLVATVNPCGFAMLPAYLSYFIGTDTDVSLSRSASLSRGLVVGTVVSSGFLAVFGLAGLLLTLGLQSLTDVLPWLALVIGIGLGVLGIAMIRGYYLNVRIPGIRGAKKERNLRSLFLFGVSYAIASLSCTRSRLSAVLPAVNSKGCRNPSVPPGSSPISRNRSAMYAPASRSPSVPVSRPSSRSSARKTT